MSRAFTVLCIVMAFLWVPMTAHCELAEVLGLGNAHAEECSDHASAPVGCDHCSLCQTLDGGVVSSASHSFLHLHSLDFKPALLPVFRFTGDPMAVPPSDAAPSADPSPPRAELSPTSWQFLQRTALAPRAPSLAS